MVKKVLMITCIIIIIMSVLIAFNTSASFIQLPPLDELKKINPPISYISTEKDYRSLEYYYKYDIQNLNDLINYSNVVLEVKPLDDGVPVALSILRKSKVLKVLKGNYAKELVYIYEPSYFIHTRSYMCIQGYISMKKDKTYILFLQKIKIPENLKRSSLKDGYFLTNASFGKFKLGEKAVLSNFNDNKKIFFNDVYELPVLFKFQKDVDLYNKLLNELETQYDI
ncbi:hypothetical protein CLTEP_24250 [Clostridium tepidiprofundi DSM 19306]|uniref:Uncharacterized protein n=1 Tax=Clostridium tepidiprofundi DSM 19306 TaxID=1121338 RepID=A0A151AU16_9CLOT|nr:hypothetical protein [Clostridium tepidiprofundi]KYH31146.1 hypothetical protein CLTEP_24250 [Clostridium tepidiprofundi DSM 19306]